MLILAGMLTGAVYDRRPDDPAARDRPKSNADGRNRSPDGPISYADFGRRFRTATFGCSDFVWRFLTAISDDRQEGGLRWRSISDVVVRTPTRLGRPRRPPRARSGGSARPAGASP